MSKLIVRGIGSIFREQIHTAVTHFLADATILASGLKKLLQDSKGVDPFPTTASPSNGQRHPLQSRYSTLAH